MSELFDDQRGGAFAHDESIAQQIERTTSLSGVARPAAHRFNDVECADRDRRQRRLRSSGDDYISDVIPNITERFAF